MARDVPEEEVALRDGSRVLIRPVRPDDKELFTRSWERFGEESRGAPPGGAASDRARPATLRTWR